MMTQKPHSRGTRFSLSFILCTALFFASTCPVEAVRIVKEGFEGTGYQDSWTEEGPPDTTLNPDAAIPGTPPLDFGTHSLAATVPDSTNNQAYAEHTAPEEESASYVRAYLYLAEEGLNDGELFNTLVLYNDSDQAVAGFQIGQASGVIKLKFLYWSFNDWQSCDNCIMTIQTGRWYRVDYEYDTDHGSWAVRVDGSGPSGAVFGGRRQGKIRIGIVNNTGAGQSTLYTDLAVWDDLQNTEHYVDQDNDNPLYPYDMKETASTSIPVAVNACKNGGTVYVRKSQNNYPPVIMKSHVDLIGRNADWYTPTSGDACPTMNHYPSVTFESVSDCSLEWFKLTAGGDEGQIYMAGSTDNGPVTDVTVRKCYLKNPGLSGILLDGPVSCTIESCDIDGVEHGQSGIVTYYGPNTPDLAVVRDAGSPIVIRETHIYGFSRAGIVLVGDGAVGINIEGNCNIFDNGRAGVYLKDFGPVTIAKTTIHSNGNDVSAGGSAGVVIKNVDMAEIEGNNIYDNGKAGVRIEDVTDAAVGAGLGVADPFQADYVNYIYGNYGGIAFDDGVTGTFVIRGNYIYNNSGGTFEGGGIQLGVPGRANITITQNDIAQNQLGGIAIQGVSSSPGEKCTLEISKNDVRNNVKAGGIHIGDKEGLAVGIAQNVDFTIKQNKVHHHWNAYRGGGIDARHAHSTIENNLVYRNNRGGIRFGAHPLGPALDNTVVRNNTVVNNGNVAQDRGSGIVYDTYTGYMTDPPSGTAPDEVTIRNNISAYNVRAGLRVGGQGYDCPAVLDDTDGDPYRDYNLLYGNYPRNDIFERENPPDCGWPNLNDMSCVQQQYGGCGAHFDLSQSPPIVLNGPHDIMADPLFVDMDNHDYHLGAGSPALGAGTDGIDMGAYGGPNAINDDDFPSLADFAHCLIDGYTTTGNTTEGGTCIVFDLGASYDITHVRLYRPQGSDSTPWDIYVGDTLAECIAGDMYFQEAWLEIEGGWNTGSLSDASGRYVKFVVNDALSTQLPVNAISEFSYSTDGEASWQTPVSTVEDCTDIFGLCKQGAD